MSLISVNKNSDRDQSRLREHHKQEDEGREEGWEQVTGVTHIGTELEEHREVFVD